MSNIRAHADGTIEGLHVVVACYDLTFGSQLVRVAEVAVQDSSGKYLMNAFTTQFTNAYTSDPPSVTCDIGGSLPAHFAITPSLERAVIMALVVPSLDLRVVGPLPGAVTISE
jgi:hypothetical protein